MKYHLIYNKKRFIDNQTKLSQVKFDYNYSRVSLEIILECSLEMTQYTLEFSQQIEELSLNKILSLVKKKEMKINFAYFQ